jgi:hypothetical protein
VRRFSSSLTASLLLVMAIPAAPLWAQANLPALTPQQQASRDSTRERVRRLLDQMGPRIDIAFKQSVKVPYNFSGFLRTGLNCAESFEVVISVTRDETIGLRIFPKYNGEYMNVDKARDKVTLMRQMLRFNDTNFLFWGADQGYDIFAGFTFTLESGFPGEALSIVLRSVVKLDKYVGEMIPAFE